MRERVARQLKIYQWREFATGAVQHERKPSQPAPTPTPPLSLQVDFVDCGKCLFSDPCFLWTSLFLRIWLKELILSKG
jgi:hypothetical protein